METKAPEPGFDPKVDPLLLEMGKVYHWGGMYAPGHPFLRERVKALHAFLSEQVAKEPDGCLLLGIARDKVLYRDRFVEVRTPASRAFAGDLYRNHVATIGFDPKVTPDGLSSFFQYLRELHSGKTEGVSDRYFLRQGIRGIHVSHVDYKEVLSREIEDRTPAEDGESRDEELWRMLLCSPEGDEAVEERIVDTLLSCPEAIPQMVRRAVGIEPGADPASAAGTSVAPGKPLSEFVPMEILLRIFRRLGRKLKLLPEERQSRVLLSLEEGLSGGEGDGGVTAGATSPPEICVSVTKSLTDGYTNSEFLELLAGLVSAERKGGKRLLRAFQVIAEGRDAERSLIPVLETWEREGHRTRKYYARKTWETVKRLLLDRSEESYLGEDHSRFLESLSGLPERDRNAGGSTPGTDPFQGACADPKTIRRKSVIVLVDFLLQEQQDAEFLELVPSVVQEIPALVEWRDFALLRRVLEAVADAREGDSAARREAKSKTLAAVDFRKFAEISLSDPSAVKDSGEMIDLLVKHGARSAPILLDRLLVEPDKGIRRVLLSLLVRIGEPAVPDIVGRLGDFPWYYLRNLCFILGEIGAPGTVPGLVRMLAHKEYRVRREAVQALGKIRRADPDAVSALGRILLTETLFSSAKEEPVRIDAASALSRIGGAEALSFLHRGKASRRAAVRGHCNALLRTMGGG